MKKVVSAFLLGMTALNCFAQTIYPAVDQPRTGKQFASLYEMAKQYSAYEDIRFRELKDTVLLTDDQMKALNFNRLTLWNAENRRKAERVLNEFANPGLGIRGLHAKGITGKGLMSQDR